MLIGMSVIKWNRGEVIASIRFLLKRWGWSIGKVTRFLDLLKDEKMITTRVDNGQTIIIITNYNLYNYIPGTEQQAEHLNPQQACISEELRNTKRNTTDTPPIQDRYKTNNVNKENNDNNVIESSGIAPPTAPASDESKIKKSKKAASANILFKDSEFFDKEKFAAALEKSKYADADIDYYHEAMLNWSDGQGKKRQDWLAVARSFMSGDKDKGKYKIKNNQQHDLFTNLNGNYATNQPPSTAGKNGSNHGKSSGAIKLAHSLAADLRSNDQ